MEMTVACGATPATPSDSPSGAGAGGGAPAEGGWEGSAGGCPGPPDGSGLVIVGGPPAGGGNAGVDGNGRGIGEPLAQRR